jgi:hypothetical protein
MNSTLSILVSRQPGRMRHFLRHLAATALFNCVIALVITYVLRVNAFLPNLVASMCIGLTAQVLIDGVRLALWGEGKPPKLPFFALIALSAPSAYFIGMEVASRVPGLPLGMGMQTASRSHAGPLIVTFLACAFGTFMFWNRSRIAELQARATAVEKQALQAQLSMLQAQIEPHMLFNTLANLQGLIAVDPERARHMLDQLIQYLRATLASSRAQSTTLAHEFALIEAYLGLMSVRMGARLRYTLQLPPALTGVQIPPMLLQPLVENAIKHGLEPKVDGGHIEVRAEHDGAILKLSVADTGLGLDAAPAASDSTHVGVANTRERLQAAYGGAASFALDSNTPSGVIARIALPL